MRAPRNNAIRALSENIVGGRAAYFKLTIEARLAVRSTATQLHDAGRTVTAAEEYEESNRNGFVYVIYHRCLAGIKIGRACDPEARLRNYQTGCPNREYKMAFTAYFEDCHFAEAAIHARLSILQLEGEWFNMQPHEAQQCIEDFERIFIRKTK